MRKMKALTVKMETVTLVGEGRLNVTCCVCYVYEIKCTLFFLSKHFNFFFWGGAVILDFDIYIFPWPTCFIWRPTLDESCHAFG